MAKPFDLIRELEMFKPVFQRLLQERDTYYEALRVIAAGGEEAQHIALAALGR